MGAIPIIAYVGGETPDRLAAIIGRGETAETQVRESVNTILSDVRAEGDAAILRYSREFDGAELEASSMRIPADVCQSALDNLDAPLRGAMERAADNIRRFHEHQRRTNWFTNDGDGVILGKRYTPVDSAAVYIPGGTAPLFSSVLMAAIPAKVAGVKRVAVTSPPRYEGRPHPAVLAAAVIAEVDEVYALGGVYAIGAFAYGTETIRPVDVIVGPGNAYVQQAKKEVYGTVGIDMIAGPSEIVVIADESANPVWIAADMLSQAEHGSGLEAAVAVVTSEELARKVVDEVQRQLAELPRGETAENALEQYGAVFVVPDLETACELTNRIAAEHVEVQTSDPWALVDQINHAGAIFLGAASAEPVGDYYAGTNHILPTGRAARFASSVGVDDFVKSSSIVAYSESRLAKTGRDIETMADAEGLTAHTRAITQRIDP
jgi:histidinol dehydrogenase